MRNIGPAHDQQRTVVDNLPAATDQKVAHDRRAISVPLTPVAWGLLRSLADTPLRRSPGVEARIGQIPKLTVRRYSLSRPGA